MQIGQLQAVFTAIAVYLGNTRQYIHLQAGLCLGRENPVASKKESSASFGRLDLVGTSKLLRRYHPIIAMVEF